MPGHHPTLLWRQISDQGGKQLPGSGLLFRGNRDRDPGGPAEVLTSAEAAAIIGQCSPRARLGIRNRVLLTLLYRSGLRISEALALKPSGIDLTALTIRVRNGKGGRLTRQRRCRPPRPAGRG